MILSMRVFWVIALMLVLSACGAASRYDGAEPTTPAVEPPATGSLYGRVMHPSGTAAPRATVGLRKWRAAEAFVAAATGGRSCLGQVCLSGQFVRQTSEGTYSFPDDAVTGGDISVVATYPSGSEAEVFFKKKPERQRVPDLVLWEEQPKVRQIGDYLLVEWPSQSPKATYSVQTKENGQVSAWSRARARFVPRWQVGDELTVVASSDGADAKFRHTSVPRQLQRTKPQQQTVSLGGRSCLLVGERKRAVVREDKIEVSRDGAAFTVVPVSAPRWGVRNTVLGNDIRYVCGRDVELW